jgi:hypothetical protein
MTFNNLPCKGEGRGGIKSSSSKFVSPVHPAFPRFKLIQFASGLFTCGWGPSYECLRYYPGFGVSNKPAKGDSRRIWRGLSGLKDSGRDCFSLEFVYTKVTITVCLGLLSHRRASLFTRCFPLYKADSKYGCLAPPSTCTNVVKSLEVGRCQGLDIQGVHATLQSTPLLLRTRLFRRCFVWIRFGALYLRKFLTQHLYLNLVCLLHRQKEESAEMIGTIGPTSFQIEVVLLQLFFQCLCC